MPTIAAHPVAHLPLRKDPALLQSDIGSRVLPSPQLLEALFGTWNIAASIREGCSPHHFEPEVRAHPERNVEDTLVPHVYFDPNDDRNVEERDRRKVVFWLSQICEIMKWQHSTFICCANAFDRYLIQFPRLRNCELPRVSVACLYIGEAAMGNSQAKVSDFVRHTSEHGSVSDIVETQRQIAQSLRGKFLTASPFSSVIKFLGHLRSSNRGVYRKIAESQDGDVEETLQFIKNIFAMDVVVGIRPGIPADEIALALLWVIYCGALTESQPAVSLMRFLELCGVPTESLREELDGAINSPCYYLSAPVERFTDDAPIEDIQQFMMPQSFAPLGYAGYLLDLAAECSHRMAPPSAIDAVLSDAEAIARRAEKLLSGATTTATAGEVTAQCPGVPQAIVMESVRTALMYLQAHPRCSPSLSQSRAACSFIHHLRDALAFDAVIGVSPPIAPDIFALSLLQQMLRGLPNLETPLAPSELLVICGVPEGCLHATTAAMHRVIHSPATALQRQEPLFRMEGEHHSHPRAGVPCTAISYATFLRDLTAATDCGVSSGDQLLSDDEIWATLPKRIFAHHHYNYRVFSTKEPTRAQMQIASSVSEKHRDAGGPGDHAGASRHC